MSLKVRKELIDDERYESAGFMDVDADRHLDIVSGSYWYEGPDFQKKHLVVPLQPQDDEYFDDFRSG